MQKPHRGFLNDQEVVENDIFPKAIFSWELCCEPTLPVRNSSRMPAATFERVAVTSSHCIAGRSGDWTARCSHSAAISAEESTQIPMWTSRWLCVPPATPLKRPSRA